MLFSVPIPVICIQLSVIPIICRPIGILDNHLQIFLGEFEFLRKFCDYFFDMWKTGQTTIENR